MDISTISASRRRCSNDSAFRSGCILVTSRSRPIRTGIALSDRGCCIRWPIRELQPGAVDLPGRPQVIATPGHTDGECVFLLADRRILLTGDALVTLDPYTGFRGPRIIARAATHDSRQALQSVASLATLGVDHVLPGHGEPWQHGIESAVQSALQNGGR
jgi:glyoxylase-like metal-dependent hydrolase (beta-lactamase superfamily II)